MVPVPENVEALSEVQPHQVLGIVAVKDQSLRIREGCVIDQPSGEEVHQIPGVQSQVHTEFDVLRRLSPSLNGSIFDVIDDQAAVVGDLHHRSQGQGQSPVAVHLGAEEHEQRAPAFAAAAQQIPGRVADALPQLDGDRVQLISGLKARPVIADCFGNDPPDLRLHRLDLVFQSFEQRDRIHPSSVSDLEVSSR